VQTSGYHQMQYEPNVIFESDRDALTDALKFEYSLPFNSTYRRICGAHYKWAS
jgi:hypothetical protein